MAIIIVGGGGGGSGATPGQVAQINQNSTDISTLETTQIAQDGNIGDNSTDIATNLASILTNVSGISSNAGNISTNSTGLLSKVNLPSGETPGFLAAVDATGNAIEYIVAPSGDQTVDYKGDYSVDTNTPDLLSSSTQLSGSVQVFPAPTTVVTGSGTLFTTEVLVGDKIEVNGAIYEVASITNDTELNTVSPIPVNFIGNISTVSAPSTSVSSGDIYYISDDGSFYSAIVCAGDTLISRIDDPLIVSDWIILNKNSNDKLIGIKPVRVNGSANIYWSPSNGDDENTGQLGSPFATLDRVQQELDQYNWLDQDPLTVHVIGSSDPGDFTILGSDLYRIGTLSVQLELDNPYTGTCELLNFKSSFVNVNGAFTGAGSVVIKDSPNITLGIGGSLNFTTTTTSSAIDISNGTDIIIGTVNITDTLTNSFYKFTDITGNITGGLDTISGTHDTTDFFLLDNCNQFSVTSGAATLNTGKVINAAASPFCIFTNLSGLNITGVDPDILPQIYTDSSDLFAIEYALTATVTGTVAATDRSLVVMDVSAGIGTVTAPPNPRDQAYFAVSDILANAATNNITVDFTGSSLHGVVDDTYVINTDSGFKKFLYTGTTWIGV